MMRYLEGSYQQNGESVMCIFVVVSFLIIVCFQFIVPNTLHSLANFYDVILSASNLMTWYVHNPNAYAETINDSQKLNIIGDYRRPSSLEYC